MGSVATFAPDQSRHIATVLRMRPGDRVVVFDGTGAEYIAELETVTPTRTAARIIETHRGVSPALHLALLQGVPTGAKMDDIVRMGTELGVTEFIPFISARTVAIGRGRVGRWLRIAMEAAKQCRRSDVPAVHTPAPLPAALDRVAGYDLVLLLWEGEESRTIAQALAANGRAKRVAIVIGPEGGFAPEEVAQATARGAVPVTMGPLILRTETGGVAALAMVSYELILRPAAGSVPREGPWLPSQHTSVRSPYPRALLLCPPIRPGLFSKTAWRFRACASERPARQEAKWSLPRA